MEQLKCTKRSIARKRRSYNKYRNVIKQKSVASDAFTLFSYLNLNQGMVTLQLNTNHYSELVI